MITSVHIADVGASKALRVRAPKPGSISGLRRADVGLAAPLSARLLASPQSAAV